MRRRKLAGLVVATLLMRASRRGLRSAPSSRPAPPASVIRTSPRTGMVATTSSLLPGRALRPDRDRLTGVATIRARATKNLSSVQSRLRRPEPAQGDRQRRRHARGSATGRADRDAPARASEGSTFTAVFRYDGVPEPIEDLFGLSGFIHTDDGALVIGQPHVASSWFPANDHPATRPRFPIRITVPRGLEAISNGVLAAQATSGGWSTWTWDAREPMAPYLATMAIGQFDVRSYRADGIKYWDAIDQELMEVACRAARRTSSSPSRRSASRRTSA